MCAILLCDPRVSLIWPSTVITSSAGCGLEVGPGELSGRILQSRRPALNGRPVAHDDLLLRDTVPDHARYVHHWLKVMRTDARAVFAAAARAQEAVTYLDGLQRPPARQSAA